MGKSGEKWLKVVKSGESGERKEKWGKVGKSKEKWGKVRKSGEKWGKLVKNAEKLGKVGKSGEKLETVGNSFKSGGKNSKSACPVCADGVGLWGALVSVSKPCNTCSKADGAGSGGVETGKQASKHCLQPIRLWLGGGNRCHHPIIHCFT